MEAQKSNNNNLKIADYITKIRNLQDEVEKQRKNANKN